MLGGYEQTDLAQDREKKASCCEGGNEPSAYVKCGECLEYLKIY
jgi:hypothetical protein